MTNGGGIGNLTAALDFCLAILRKNIGKQPEDNGEWEWKYEEY